MNSNEAKPIFLWMVINPLVSGFHISCLGILFMRLRYHVIYRTINMGSYGFVLKWGIPINGTLIWKSWEFDCWVPMFRQTHMGMGQNLGSCLRLFIYVFMIHLLGYLILTHIDARKWALASGKKKTNILMLIIPTKTSFVHFVNGHKAPYFWCILPKCTYTIVMPLQMTR